MLHTTPFTAIEQTHLVQPFVHRITERAIEVAVEKVPFLDHSVYFPMNPAERELQYIDSLPMGSNNIHSHEWLSSHLPLQKTMAVI